MKLSKIKGIQGWYMRKDGTLVVFLDPKAGSDVVEQVLMAAGTAKVEMFLPPLGILLVAR